MRKIIRMLLEYNKREKGRWSDILSVRAVKKWNMLNVDLKQSSNAKICKRSLFKSLLNNQMLTHSPNVNYFHKVFKFFSFQNFSSEYCISGVLIGSL